MINISAGIDIGGTNTSIGLVDTTGQILIKENIATPTHGNIKIYIDKIHSTINDLLIKCQLSVDNLLGIGIGAPNANYYTGCIEEAPNLSFKGIVPLVELLKEKFPTKETIILTNDANAAAMGEMIFGGAKGMQNFVMVTLGTGVGSGLIVNGQLVYGHDGFAGECGHTVLVPNGRMCGCGINGHLETYCSATGIKRTAFELLAYYNAFESILANYSYSELSSKIIYEAATDNDFIALKVFEKTGQWLGKSLADTVHHLSPEAIILFGGPMAAGDLIIKPTKESMEQFLLPVFKNKVEIFCSKLPAGDAATLGASALVINELNT